MTAPPVERSPVRAFVHTRVGGLPREFWVLFSGTAINKLGTMAQPLMGIYLTQSRGVSVATTGVILTLWGCGSLLSQPIAGFLADRVGRRATLAGGMTATAATMIFLGYAWDLTAIAAGMFVLGLVVDTYRPASQALLADVVSPEDRPRAFGLLFWAINLGFSIAMVAGGRLASSGFLLLFWVDAASCLIFAYLVWRLIPETRPPAAERLPGGYRDVLRDRTMVAFVLMNLAYTCTYLQAFQTMAIAMTQRGLSPEAYGTAIAVNGLLIILVQPITTAWLVRFSPSLVLAAGFAVVGVGFGLQAFATTTLEYALAIVVWTCGEILTAGMPLAITSALAPPHLRGRYNGLYGLSWSVGAAVTPMLGTRLLEIGHEALWLTTGALGLVAAIGQIILAPAIRHRTKTQ
ncbi:MDR family MFS transporter [Herbidospora mongoliensis]|uniref:MDR family MFS transporter n=1 Tax=Herbidospora mongoliensis TaxID=688067 RepID=UPI0008296168|nr:MFS transporter [Herbidospora mongoliensis]